MTRILPGVLAMAATVLASNILVQFLVGEWLTWGAFAAAGAKSPVTLPKRTEHP